MKKIRTRNKVILLLLLLTVGYIGKNVFDICSFSTEDQRQKADVAIILGAAAYNGEVSPVFRERIDHGITLYQERYVDRLIVTGGTAEGAKGSEAAAARDYLLSQGISEEAVLLEEESTITQENLENSKVIMEENGFETAVIVSDPLHMKRAMLLAEDAGINAYSSPTPTSRYVSLRTKIPFLARETFYYIGYKWYRIFFPK